DAAPRMIAEAERRRVRLGAERVRFEVGDMCALAMKSGSARIVTAGYGLRNVPDFRIAIAEIARVLEPDGVFVALDFYRPTSALWRRLFLGYLAIAGNIVGWAWHREPVVYGYIARSIDHFVSIEEFSGALEDAGLQVERVTRKLRGGVAIHVARKVRGAGK
ncbi:MAG: class I SAM-dependent methyltransferase, partial [Gemmatimonadota bacterium]|nr:class I SAM-dependent methyltransferase [Gemmatimonadota bacterium]